MSETDRPAGHPLRHLLGSADFRRLYATRLVGQFGDGVFQAALAGSILFNPDRQADPLAVAVGFAVILLPYSLVGPFTGVLLDRRDRRAVMAGANVVRAALVLVAAAILGAGGRAAPFLVLALVTIAVNRFFLAGLSAALPRVAPAGTLVVANALTPTSGTIAYTVGIGAAVGAQRLTGGGDHGYALVILGAAGCYAAAAALVSRYPRGKLGPDEYERAAQPHVLAALRAAVLGTAAAVGHLARRRAAGAALLTVGGYRFGFGITTIALLLLYRGELTGTGPFPAGETGLGQLVLLTGCGAFVAALVTPAVTRRLPARAWVAVLLALAATLGTLPVLLYTTPAMAGAALVGGLAAQGIKIVADTTVQTVTDDVFRGRVFAVYDMVFNVCLVSGLLLGAATLPASGRSAPVVLAVAVGYLALGGVWCAAYLAGRRSGAGPGSIPDPAGKPDHHSDAQ